MRSRILYYLSLSAVIITALILLCVNIPFLQKKDSSEDVKSAQLSSRSQRDRNKQDKPQDNRKSQETEDYILHPANLCLRGNSQLQLDYLVLIFSAPNNFDQRNAIRETWASELKERSNSRVAFLLARTKDDRVQRAIESESYLHADIVQGTHIDHYKNQTLKMKMMMKWALQYCHNISFLFKCDDDTFVNVGNLLNAMKDKRTDAIYGDLYINERPHRDPSSKYYVSEKDYNGITFPPFVTGTLYMLGGSILRRLFEASEVATFVWLEDVFLTGFVAQKAGVDLIDETAITSVDMKSACGVLSRLNAPSMTPKMMRLFWHQIHSTIMKCE
ncbi:beta-1,3-galactosyltransferase 5-like [Ixodes scapularis]